MVESLILKYGHGFLYQNYGFLQNEVVIRENHERDKHDLLKRIGIENVKTTIFLTDLTFLSPKLINYQSNLWYFCD